MKIIVKKSDLVPATQAVHNMVSPQSNAPILGSILIKTQDGGVTFMASDSDACVRYRVAATIERDGAVTVPARTFAELTRELPETDVAISLDEEGSVLVECLGANYRLTTMDPEKFPEWPYIESQTTFVISQPQLKRSIESVLFAIPARDPRKVLLGALFDLKEGKLITVATDGKKLGYVSQEPTEIIGEQDGQAIVPSKLLSEVVKVLGDEGEVKVTLGQRQVCFELGSCTFIGNKIDGAYPNYEMVIPKQFEHIALLDKLSLVSCVRRASIISDEKNNSVILKFLNKRVEVTSMTYDIGSFAGEMQAETAEDLDGFEIVFNHRFLLEVLRVIGAEKIEMKLNKPASPAVIMAQGDENTLFVVMPIKLADLAQPVNE